MRTKVSMLSFFLMFAVAGATVASAATGSQNTVMILFDGVTEVNREAVNYIYKGMQQAGVRYALNYTQNPQDIKPGAFKAVVVLSTGYPSGVDPKLQSFIQGYSAKSEIILVQLFARSNDWSVRELAAPANPLGVDAISAASAWGGRGGRGSIPGAQTGSFSDPRLMHAAWVADLLKRIGT